MKNARSSFALAVAWLLLSMPAQAVLFSDDVAFTTVYDGTALPQSSSPVWQALGQAPGSATGISEEVVDGVLRLETPATGARYYRILSTGSWDGSTATGSTVEFRLQVGSMAAGATNATIILLAVGDKAYSFYFRPMGITHGGTNAPVHEFDTSSDFNTYRITLSPTEGANLYVNGNVTPLISGYAGGAISPWTNHVYFGDASGSAGGVIYFDYFAFTNAGVFAPVPEPATVGLLLFGAVVVIRGCYSRKKA